ncbi:MAG: ABC transporter ATP-binding protein [Candidatus Omnitrophica bacterium]|nr:ABC transporter ATP-binding protein [Candidatus Omnitrophota bacterium]
MLIVEKLWKRYTIGETTLEILKGADLEVPTGQFISIVGASGTGKSTLLHLLGGIDRPDQGTVLVDGTSLFEGSPKQIARRRNSQIGFVFQFHHLLPEFTTLENAALPRRIMGASEREANSIAEERLTEVGLSERLDHLPTQLSGGERQRVAIARALVNEPSLLLMDEPTGNLDPKTGDRLFDLITNLQKEQNLTVIMVTHNHELADKTDACYELVDGKLVLQPPA